MLLPWLAGLLALGLLWSFLEPFWIRRRHLRLPLDEARRLRLERRRCQNAPPLRAQDRERAAGRLRFVFFSDLHAGYFFSSARRLCRLLLESKPDFILFGGDLISRPGEARRGLALARELSRAAARAQTPVFAVRGNHDVSLSDADLKAAGLLLMDNRGIKMKLKGAAQGGGAREFILYGLEDRRSGRPDPAAARTRDLLEHAEVLNLLFPQSRLSFLSLRAESAPAAPPPFRAVLAHNPDSALGLAADEAELCLCGHFHGGQIRLPFRLEFKSLRGEELSRRGYYAGLMRPGAVLTYISRGIGCVLFPLRFLCPPEITVFDVELTA